MLYLAWNARGPAKRQGPELKVLISSADPLLQRVSYLKKQTVQLSRPVHGLTETGMHAFVQTVSHVFWNEKGELYRKDML